MLFDTGQDRASVTDPDYFPSGMTGWFYRRTAKADIPEDQTLVAGLGRLGYHASTSRRRSCPTSTRTTSAASQSFPVHAFT